MCGEKSCAQLGTSSIVGSPPRVRGKGIVVTVHSRAAGLTPACAGKRAWHQCPEAVRKDHPRVCGEKYFARIPSASIAGSPPRVRGKAELTPLASPHSRITPACAGKSRFSIEDNGKDEGSPPRVRGKARENGCFGAAEEDHPRVCGEKIIRGAHRLLNKGSPPRVRGKVILIVSISSSMRITPACAGKRTLADAKAASCRDHPRVCGEKTAHISPQTAVMGSPPRVRGKD